MAHLVARNGQALLGVHQPAVLLEAGDDTLDTRGEVLHRHRFGIAPGGVECRLVDQIGQVRPGEPRRQPGDLVRIDVARDLCRAQMHFQYLRAAGPVGAIHQDMPVEASRPQQGRIEDFGPIGRGEDDDAAAGIESVHFRQELIERLFLLVMTAQHR